MALAQGTGPLIFAWIFNATTSGSTAQGGSWPLPYFPGAVFLVGAGLIVGAMGVAASLHNRHFVQRSCNR